MCESDRREYWRRYYAANAERKREQARERARRRPREALRAADARYRKRWSNVIKYARAMGVSRGEAREILEMSL